MRLNLYYKAHQHGAALMITIVITVVGIAAALVGALSSTALKNARQEKTSAALAQAKEALVGYAVKDNNRPGELPCPDFNNDGMITLADYSGSNCQSLIGRLPWITLGLPELRDGSGEHLWYALSNPFHANGSVVLNSNTKGTLLVYSADGVTPQTAAGYDAVAIIFSPGSAFGLQTRNSVAEKNSAANYLDSIVIDPAIPIIRNNASAAGPFIAGEISGTFNDQLLFITTKSLIPLIEQRVAGEVKRALTNYYTDNGYYPWADTVMTAADYDSNTGLNRGWLPNNVLLPIANWAVTSRPPQWFFDNEWYKLIYYSVGKSYTADPLSCSSCSISPTLSVDGIAGVKALFFMPGTPIGTLTRTSTNLSHYLEDPQNNDDANDLYVTPTLQAGDRDRLYLLP